MWSVFIKEWRQIRHNVSFGVLLILTLVFEILGALAIYAPVSSISPHTDSADGIILALGALNTLFALIMIAVFGNRWRVERGDASLDIVNTTPLSPLQISAGKVLATCCSVWLLALIQLPLPLFYHLGSLSALAYSLPAQLLSTVAACALFLGFCAIAPKRRGHGAEGGFLLAILVAWPLVGYATSIGCSPCAVEGVNCLNDACTRSVTAIAATLFGFGLMLAGTGSSCSNRVMPLKVIILLEVLVLPAIYYLLDHNFAALTANGRWVANYMIPLYLAADLALLMALFERTRQSRRVLKYRSIKLLFPLFSGTANSLVMALLYAGAAFLIGQRLQIEGREFMLWQFTLLLLYSSIAQYLHWLTAKSAQPVNRVAAFLIVMLCCWLPALLSLAWESMDEYLNILTPWYLKLADFNGYLCIGLIAISVLLQLPLLSREINLCYAENEDADNA